MKLCLVCHFQFSDDQSVCPKDNAKLVTLGADPLIGTVIQDRYRLDAVIGKGAMGVVYRATQELIGREVAVKLLHSHLVQDQESLKRFHQQAKAASRLNHPHIITLYDYGVIQGGQPYIVMDLLQGIALSTMIEEKQCLTVEEVVPIFKQVCEALGDAHKHGVVHRDVKPENIVLEETNSNKNWVKVVDFGIAKLVQGTDDTLTRITKTGMVCGSPAYMSPEQYRGADIDQRSDIYSLGAVLFESLTGRVPFIALDLISLMSMHVSERPPSLSSVRPQAEFSPAIEMVVERALAKDPGNRQQTMEEFFDELNAAASDKRRIVRRADNVDESAVAALEKHVHTLSDQELKEVVEDKLAQRIARISQDKVKAALDKKEQSQPSMPGVRGRGKKTVSVWVRLIALGEWIFPYALTIGFVLAAHWIFTNEDEIARFVNQFLPGEQKPLPKGDLKERKRR